jgi:hypothetical protein
MDTVQRFLAYAGDFERTLADDDWTRLRPHFADEAVYEITGEVLPCRLVGPAAIFAGMKKSLDGLDRRFSGRDLAVTSGPDIDGETLRAGWMVTYTRDGAPPFVLRGVTTARVRDGRIVYLADAFDGGVATDLAAWQRATGVALDPAYT